MNTDRKIALTDHGFSEDIPYVSPEFSKSKLYQAYENAYADKEHEAASMAALPIEKVKSRILLLAGQKDSSWPAAYSVQLLYDRLKASGFQYSCKKIVYPKYGHVLFLKKTVMNRVFTWIRGN